MTAKPPQNQEPPSLRQPGPELEASPSRIGPGSKQSGHDLMEQAVGIRKTHRPDPAKGPGQLEQLGKTIGIPGPQPAFGVSADPGGIAADRPGEGPVERGVRGVEPRRPAQLR